MMNTQDRKRGRAKIYRLPKECTRSPSSLSRREHMSQEVCFFCGQRAGTDGLHEAATLQIDGQAQACATFLEDTELLGQLSAGDMVALEASIIATA